MRRFILVFSFLFLLVGLPAAVLSQQDEPLGLSVVPALSDYVVAPGQLSLKEINVTNITDIDLPIRIGFRSITPVDAVVDNVDRDRFDASAWLSVDGDSLILKPGQTKTVEVRIQPPSDAGAGGHYATVVFRVLNGFNANNSLTASSPEISSLLFLTVPGNIEEAANLSYSSPGLVQFNKTRHFSINFTNVGNVHILPTATISVEKIGGGEVAQLSAQPKLVIPGTTSVLDTSWIPDDPGIYRAKYKVTYGTASRTEAHTSQWFIVLPSLWIIGVLLSSLILGMVILWYRVIGQVFRRRKVRLYKDNHDKNAEFAETKKFKPTRQKKTDKDQWPKL